MRISDWSSDVCSSDLPVGHERRGRRGIAILAGQGVQVLGGLLEALVLLQAADKVRARVVFQRLVLGRARQQHPRLDLGQDRSEEHTSELQSLMRNSYADFYWQKKNNMQNKTNTHTKTSK